jgi:leucyl/phenylalanyl-tRNA--protein transferase
VEEEFLDLFFLDDSDGIRFPDPALADPDGLTAIGGDLSIPRLLEAYRIGLFPWYNPQDSPIWWCPDPRFVIFPEEINVSKTMRQTLRREVFRVTYDQCFERVMRACGKTPRRGQSGTWVSRDFLEAYTELHRLGYAHSVEVWHGDELAGGLYGVCLGKCFFGESMFTWVDNASKTALITLARHLQERGFWLIDCQMRTDHLVSMGARGIPRSDFLDFMRRNEAEKTPLGSWAHWIL